MDRILTPDTSGFPFADVALTSPIMVTGGNYFIKCLLQGDPIYIQMPKCKTRQGIVKAGKRYFCDLLFTNENEEFIRWIEELETLSQTKLFENRTKWFESNLEMHDIENSFTSSLKVYKSGKYYLLRIQIPSRLGKCSLKLYDEHENDVDIAQVTDQTNVVTILEVQGIKCSSRNFQLEFECKQMMILKPEKIFEKCVISFGTAETMAAPTTLKTLVPEADETPSEHLGESAPPTAPAEAVPPVSVPSVPPAQSDAGETSLEEMSIISPIQEIDVSLHKMDDQDPPLSLKPRTDVYYDLYRQALQKAKETRLLAIRTYLEAKQIKDLYKLADSELDDDLWDLGDETDTLAEMETV